MPAHLDIQSVDVICWAHILPGVDYEKRCRFYDGSLGRPDPRFHHIAIAPDRAEGFEPHYLVAYFDEKGAWITQSPFDTLQEAIDHGRHAFELKDWQWHWVDTDSLQNCDVHS